MRRVVNPEETKTDRLMEYALVALAQLGGTATKGQIVDRVGEMLENRLTSADRAQVYRGDEGKTAYAPSGYTGETWDVWAGKTKQAIVNVRREKLIETVGEACTLTPAGLKHIAMQAENWLKVK
jgi:hypothetical protein